jgi:predicted GNAT family N-acyltransferase
MSAKSTNEVRTIRERAPKGDASTAATFEDDSKPELSFTTSTSTTPATEAKHAGRYRSGVAPTHSAQAIRMFVELFDIRDAARMERALAIRTRVFVQEQHVPLELEIDEHDQTDPETVHALIFETEEAAEDPSNAIGTGRYFILQPGTAQIGRMAILEEHRKSGAGKALLEALADEAKQSGLTRAYLTAQTYARGFYIKSGYRDDGEKLWDAGIEHQPMSKVL